MPTLNKVLDAFCVGTLVFCLIQLFMVCSSAFNSSRSKAKGMESRLSLSTWLMLQRHWTGVQHVSNPMHSIICCLLYSTLQLVSIQDLNKSVGQGLIRWLLHCNMWCHFSSALQTRPSFLVVNLALRPSLIPKMTVTSSTDPMRRTSCRTCLMGSSENLCCVLSVTTLKLTW